MLYVLLCKDKLGSLELRMKVRADHLTYLSSLGDKMKAAGPFLDENGSPAGSMVIVEADSSAAAKEMASADPYAKAGLFSEVEIKPWRWTLKNPEVK